MKKINKPNKIRKVAINIACLAAVFIFMAIAALMHSGRILGYTPGASDSAPSHIKTIGDTTIVNTTTICRNVSGYSGPVPVEITFVDDVMIKVEALDNTETPAFFKNVTESGILQKWNGLTASEASKIEVDGVSGATFSSKALITNIRTGISSYLEYTAGRQQSDKLQSYTPSEHSLSFYAAIAVVIAAMSVPLFWKNNKYRIIQQILNTAVLGFWAGTFVDYTIILNIMSNGITATTSIIALLMLVTAFIYPLFGKQGYYCAWVCPLGSIQELASRCNSKHRLKLGKRTIELLTRFRMILWAVLMLCLWTGLWMSWINYELFTSFMISHAATGILIAGTVLIILSIFIQRPYCRFVCPTGTILRMSQNIETK